MILIYLVGKMNLFIKFNRQATQLFSESKNISDKKFTYKQLIDLPQLVQRYFKNFLKEDQLFISYLQLQHN